MIDVSCGCKLCYEEFPGSSAQRQQKDTRDDVFHTSTTVDFSMFSTRLMIRVPKRLVFASKTPRSV